MQEATQVLRFLTNLRVKHVLSREKRPYLLVDSLHFEPTGVQPGSTSGPFDEPAAVPVGVLRVSGTCSCLWCFENPASSFPPPTYHNTQHASSPSGYLRGGPLSANDLIHLPDFGDFQMSKIDGPPDPQPYSTRVAAKKGEKMDATDDTQSDKTELLDVADPDKQVA